MGKHRAATSVGYARFQLIRINPIGGVEAVVYGIEVTDGFQLIRINPIGGDNKSFRNCRRDTGVSN